MKPVVHELFDDATVAGGTSRNPVGLGGESEVHDPEQAPSPPCIDRARHEHRVGAAPISVTVPVTKRIREFDAV
jgi:hypothetical protein